FKTINNGADWTNVLSFQVSPPTFPSDILPPTFFVGPGSVRSLAINFINPNTLYTVTERTDGCSWTDRLLFKSIDGGARWDSSVSQYGSGCVLSGLLVMDSTDPNTLYVGESDLLDAGYWLEKSTDGGSTWRSIWKGLKSGLNALVIDPTDPTILYAGT